MSLNLPALTPVSVAPIACKICGGSAALYGVVDFNKSCEEARGLRLQLSGVPIYYRRCANCEFLFTDAFDGWSNNKFKEHIYNEDYHMVDPGYGIERPRSNAGAVAQLWAAHKAEMRVLDFGGGNDVFCNTLRAHGFSGAITYDPIVPEHASRPDGKFDLVTCFETFEHLPDPLASAALILECLSETGLVLFSTSTQPSDFEKTGLAWWYIGPRNGHISIFSKRALAVLWGRYGYKTISLTDNIHLAFRTLPSFLAHLQSTADSLLGPKDRLGLTFVDAA
jgi:hypothetical protein